MRLRPTFVLAALLAAAPALGQSADLAQRLESLATSGNAEAQHHLGMLYNNGLGVAKDPKRAFGYFMAAAKGGNPLGSYKVGCYYAGQFPGEVPPDDEQSLRYKLVAAEAGYALAQLDVAILYYKREDFPNAGRWFEAAARQGDTQALYNLSVFAKEGSVGPASIPRSWAFFRLAHLAARGKVSPSAQESLDEIWAAMSTAQRKEAEEIVATWVTGRTPLTREALNGLERAEALAAAAR